MEYVICIFILGLMVTLLVGKGLLEADEFAKTELGRQSAAAPRAEKDST